LRLAVSVLNFAGKARGHPSRRTAKAGRDGVVRAGDGAVTSALKDDLEQFQGRDDDEQGGDDHEHGANPMPCRCRMLTNHSGTTFAQ
jgi:hypothetical protein